MKTETKEEKAKLERAEVKGQRTNSIRVRAKENRKLDQKSDQNT